MVFDVLSGGGALGFFGADDDCLLRAVNERNISRGYNREDDLTKMRLGQSNIWKLEILTHPGHLY